MLQVSNTSAKENLIAWFIIVIIAFFLWYRNLEYDRVLSLLTFGFGLFCLICYGVYNTMNIKQASKMIVIIGWLQTVIINLSVWIFLRSKQNESDLSLYLSIFYSIIFIISIILAVTDNISSLLTWKNDNILWIGDLFWFTLYVIGILAPLLLLANYRGNPGLIILITYLVIGFALITSDKTVPVSYILLGLTFLSYMMGLFY